MDAKALRAWCLEQPGAVEEFPFGPETSVFKVARKIFAISALDRAPLNVSVKCEPELAVALRSSYPAIRPGYHLDKRHWNTVTLDGSIPVAELQVMIDSSYMLVFNGLTRAERQRLGA